MPKVKLNREPPKPVDWLWAVVLERRASRSMTLKEMAKVAGVSYGTMRNYSMKSPWDWPPRMRDNICKEFGITLTVNTPNGVDLEVAV